MAAKKADRKGVNPDIEKLIKREIKRLLDDESDTISLTDKCKIIDRALALEKVKAAIEDEGFGTAFDD